MSDFLLLMPQAAAKFTAASRTLVTKCNPFLLGPQAGARFSEASRGLGFTYINTLQES